MSYSTGIAIGFLSRCGRLTEVVFTLDSVFTKGQKTESGSTNYFEHVQSYDAHTKKVTDVKFGADALWLASTSMDRTVKFFA
jgi:WD40 repeat protein